MKIVYPVVFYEGKNGDYSVYIPDLLENFKKRASASSDTLSELMSKSEDLIAELIIEDLEKGNKIPQPSRIEDVNYKKLEDSLKIVKKDYVSKFKSYILVDINKYTSRWGTDLIKKTVNIPKWLNTKADEQKINFSKTLEEALMEKIYK